MTMDRIVEILDVKDERIALYRDIRERDLVGRQKRFVAEGKVVLQAALRQNRFEIVSLLVSSRKLPGLSDVLADVPCTTPVYVADQVTMDGIAGFHIHRGILAIVEIREEPDAGSIVSALEENAVVVLLSAISNHDNMGGLFRNAAAFGANAVLIDKLCCDPLYRKSIRVSVGGVLQVPFARVGSVEAGLEMLEGRGFEVISLSPAGTSDISEITLPKRCVFVLGSEGKGLEKAVLDRTQTASIKISQSFDSLNVAAASAIALHRYRSSFPLG